MGEQLLSVEGLNAFYGSAHVLDDVSFDVENEQPVAVIGRNGMGKTTLCAAIMGLPPKSSRHSERRRSLDTRLPNADGSHRASGNQSSRPKRLRTPY